MNGWGDAEAAAYYESFCQRHGRYLDANRELIAHAQIAPGMRILDVGGGTGRTAEAALLPLGESGSVVCFEPSAAMRAEGMLRITDGRVSWTEALSDSTELFDRILCGAAIWQVTPLPETFRTLADLLFQGGALCFNIPALYLSEGDEPGDGGDPYLLSLVESLMTSPDATMHANEIEAYDHVSLSQDSITAWLRDAGLRPRPWSFRLRISQAEYADWLKIPVLTGQLLGNLSPAARAERLDKAFALLTPMDQDSWKWEHWRGWTAWKEDSMP
jgi:SAM-dependent methyltransferase